MSRLGSIAIVLAAALCVSPPARAEGRWTVGVLGGLSIPTGDFGSSDSLGLDARTGPLAGLEVGCQVTDRISVGADASWIRNRHGIEGNVADVGGGATLTADKDRFRMLRFGAHARFMVPVERSPVHPYGLIGIAVYDFKEDYQYTLAGGGGPTIVYSDETDVVRQQGARIGGRIGLGGTYQAARRLGVDLRAEFDVVSTDKNRNGALSSATFIGVQAGLSYRLGGD